MTIPTPPSSFRGKHPLRLILWAIFLTTLLTTGLPNSLEFLGLSFAGLQKWRLWTLLTYLFTYPPLSYLNLAIHLGFDLLLLWIFGLPVLDRLGSKRFSFLFFGSALSGGALSSALLLASRSNQILASPSPALLSLIVVWTLFHVERPVPISRNLALRPFAVFSILVGLNLAFDALDGRWIQLSADAAGALFGYFFGLISERAGSELSFLAPFERFVFRMLEKKPAYKGPKIYDFQTGQPKLSDEEFMDAMLSRISLKGKESITPEEKNRMDQIAKRKNQHLS